MDFDELGAGETADTVLEPREIFSALPAKDARYQYPRDVQSEVWTGWFARRDEPEVVLKMNTGGGKTVVGLLVLKSCLNEGKGPAVYVCPDPLLVDQVIQEARALGLEVTDDEDDFRFRRGQAILVINIYKLINGKSRFGVGSEGTKIRIGSVIIDDVHACLSTTLNQFTLTLEAPADAYTKLLALFKEELHRQSEATALDIEQGYPNAIMQVPFWAWQSSLNKVTSILSSPTTSSDVGDRMILVPQELNGTAEDGEVKTLAKKVSATHNVVVIVPSHKRAEFWADVAVMTLSSSAKNLADGITKLRAGHVGLVVLVNRYDGIDLPHAACRVLIVDGLPDVRRKIECIDQSLLDGSEQIKSQSIQRIEQGMGRGIRSSEDYCVVILMGRSLISMLYADNSLSLFTTATRAQLELSQKLANQLRGKPVAELEGVMNSCLTRDRKWVAASKGVLVKLRPTAEGSVRLLAEKMRKAFDAVEIRDYPLAERLIQEAINAATDKREKGWLKHLLAEYTNYTNPVEAQKLAKSALAENRALLKPIDGIAYTRLMTPDMNQAKQCSEYLVEKYGDGNKIVIAMNGILEELDFITDNSSRFEEALKNLGFFIGFRGQRPESEVGKGPDNVWEVGSLKYFVVEAKNGATTDTITKDYCNQLGGSMNWFASQYDATCSATPIMIHPSHVFEHASSPHAKARIIDAETLPLLRDACRKFAQSVANKEAYRTSAIVAELLKAHGLTADLIVARYTVKFRVK
ncbi:MAG: DEAD/DEAH box helicase family protein [Planctomycetes bacterium]|nr:DEAD/DEAH box helicase family protein [Planctomycetota bacterium]